MEDAEAERDRLSEKLQEQQVTYAKLNQAEDFLNDNIRRIRDDIDQYRMEKQTLLSQSGGYESAVKEKEAEIEQLREEMRTADADAFEKNSELQLLTKTRESHAEEQRRFFDQRDSLNTTINELTKEQYRLQSQHEKYEERLDVLTEYLWTEYQLTPSEA